MRRAYRILLRLYPKDYRELFAAGMFDAFSEAAKERREQGWSAFIRFVVTESAGLMLGACTEWIAKVTTDTSVRGRCLPDLRMMRPPGVRRELWFAGADAGTDSSLPDELIPIQERIAMLIGKTEYAIAHHDFPGARAASSGEHEARENLRQLRARYRVDHIGNDGYWQDISW
jgi:hypothetical protein